MATAKKTNPKPGTAVAVKKATSVSVANIREALQQQALANASRIEPGGGKNIRIGQDKSFSLPDGTKTREDLQLVVVDFVSRNEYYDRPYSKDDVSPPACFAIHADTYEVKSFRIRKTAWDILVVEWDECERVLSEESVHRIFDGVEIWDVHTQTAKGRSQAGAGCAFGVAVVHVKIDVLDALPAAEIAEAAE